MCRRCHNIFYANKSWFKEENEQLIPLQLSERITMVSAGLLKITKVRMANTFIIISQTCNAPVGIGIAFQKNGIAFAVNGKCGCANARMCVCVFVVLQRCTEHNANGTIFSFTDYGASGSTVNDNLLLLLWLFITAHRSITNWRSKTKRKKDRSCIGIN